jgi:hypothetical protein
MRAAGSYRRKTALLKSNNASDTVTNTYTARLRTGLGLQQPSGNWTNLFGHDAAKRPTRVESSSIPKHQRCGMFIETPVQKTSKLHRSGMWFSRDDMTHLTELWEILGHERVQVFTQVNYDCITEVTQIKIPWNQSESPHVVCYHFYFPAPAERHVYRNVIAQTIHS